MSQSETRCAPRADRRTGSFRSAGAAALAIAVGWLVPACDNPACVFGPTGCNGSAPGSSSGIAATLPANHQWIQIGAPSVTATIPPSSQTLLHPDSPFALVFSESMSAASLTSALLIDDPSSG